MHLCFVCASKGLAHSDTESSDACQRENIFTNGGVIVLETNEKLILMMFLYLSQF